jgi:hypothetical protein
MKITEFSKPITAKALNESLAQRFGQKVAIEKFTLEQLEDARNKLRTQLSQIETNESFDAVSKSEVYQKNRLFLDVLNAAISEREEIEEKKKPDADGDGVPDWADKKPGKDDNEGKKKGSKPKKGEVPPQFKKKTDEGKQIIENYFAHATKLVEGEEEQAALIMAAKDMVDRITGWMEDTAEMQTESMLELADKIRDEMGSQQSEEFTNAVKPSLESLYAALESTRGSLTSGVAILTGEGVETMGDEVPMDMGDEGDMDMEPTVDQEVDAEAEPEGDEFAAAGAAAGGEEEAGRAKRESVERSRKLGTILSKKK